MLLLFLGEADPQQFVGVELVEVGEVVVGDIEASPENGGFILGIVLKFLIEDFAEDGLTFLQEVFLR